MADQLLNTLEVTERTKAELNKARAVKVIVPFITCNGIELLLDKMRLNPKKVFHLQLLTRFDAESILAGVCDLEALRLLLNSVSAVVSVEIKRLDNLHAKCFIFDKHSLIVGSSNMTQAGQASNIELGFYSSSRTSVEAAEAEFDACWQNAFPVDLQWVQDQENVLKPFLMQYQSLRSEIRGLMTLQSIRMPGVEDDFLASLKQILKKAKSVKGTTKTWLQEEMRRAGRENKENEPNLNVNKRIMFLKVLGLVSDKDGFLRLTDFGIECHTDSRKLLAKMAMTFPLMVKSYHATPPSGLCVFKDIAHIDPDLRIPGDPSQALRDAIHWLASFGLLHQEKVGNTYRFQRKKSSLATLLPLA